MPRTSKPTNGTNGTSDSPRRARTSKKTNGGTRPAGDPAAVEKRAYEIYKGRGGNHGADLDDWLEAERQLKPVSEKVAAPAQAKPRRRKASEGTV
jgi:hypothetical protein